MTLTSAPSTDVICAFGRDVSVLENDQENVFDTGQEGSSQQSIILTTPSSLTLPRTKQNC